MTPRDPTVVQGSPNSDFGYIMGSVYEPSGIPFGLSLARDFEA